MVFDQCQGFRHLPDGLLSNFATASGGSVGVAGTRALDKSPPLKCRTFGTIMS